ncbi:hypothetical protein MRX96_011534 [Rhipicephalus microplus]
MRLGHERRFPAVTPSRLRTEAVLCRREVETDTDDRSRKGDGGSPRERNVVARIRGDHLELAVEVWLVCTNASRRRSATTCLRSILQPFLLLGVAFLLTFYQLRITLRVWVGVSCHRLSSWVVAWRHTRGNA